MGGRRSAGRRLEVVASHPHPVAEEAAYRDPVGRLAEDRPEEAAYRDPAHHPAEEVVSCRRLVAAAVACDERTVPLASEKAAFGAREWQSRPQAGPCFLGTLSTYGAVALRVAHRREEEEEA